MTEPSHPALASLVLGRFFVRAIVGFLLITALWTQVSAWISYPVAAITHIVLGNSATEWIRKIHKQPGQIELETRITVAVPESSRQRGTAELVVDADPAHYAYGLPLFLALLLASHSRHLIGRAIAGYLILLLPQAASLSFELLRQIMIAGGSPENLGIAQWQMEGIALGYQVGALLLPTLAPVAVWLWLDREFFAAVSEQIHL